LKGQDPSRVRVRRRPAASPADRPGRAADPLPAPVGLRLPVLALSVAIALVEVRLIRQMFGTLYRLSVDAASGVLAGTPHWRVFQSRQLGPRLVQAATLVLGDFERAHVLCTVGLLSAAGYLVFRSVLRRTGDDARALVSLLSFALLTVFCLSRPWLYIWDFSGALLFVVFNDLVARERRPGAFALLFAVAIFNRESALFLAAWMVLDPLCRYAVDRLAGRSPAPLDLRMMAAGAALLAAGGALVELLRDKLLVREIGPQIVGGPVPGAGPRYHYMWPDNALALKRVLHAPLDPSLDVLVLLFCVGLLAFCARLAQRDPRRFLGLALVHAAMLASAFVVGLVFETRIYFELLPVVAVQLWTVVGPRPERA
jgi:hypothetical protein